MQDIRIVYSEEQSVPYSMWSYFFESCGVWVMPQTTAEYMRSERREIQELSLFILNSSGEKLIQKFEAEDVIYLVTDELYEKYRLLARSDIYRIDWEKVSCFHKILNRMDYTGAMKEAFAIFDTQKVWGYSWIFHEINCKNDQEWNKKLIDQYESIIDEINLSGKKIENKYLEFMCIYCKYIIAALQVKSIAGQMDDIYELLESCKKYANRYGFSSALSFLVGHIYGISQAEERTSILIYDEIPEKKRTSGLLHLMGRQYENIYSDKEKALNYYEASYRMDHNYRAEYKIAISYIDSGRWKEALALYEQILRKLKEKRPYDTITIHDLEYEYKTVVKMAEIYKKYVGNEILDVARNYQKRIFLTLAKRTDFDNLFRKMFKKEMPSMKQYIMREIKRKLQTIYLQTV